MPDVPSRAAVSHIGCRVPKWEPVFTDSAKWSDFYKEMVLSVSGSLNSRFSRGRHPILCFLKHIIYRHGSLRSLHPVCSNAWSLLRVFCPGKGWNCEHHARGVHGSRYKQSRTGFMHGYLQSSVLGNKFCMISSLHEGHDRRLQGYMHGVSAIFIQGMPCISQLISHKVLSDVFLEHRTKIIYSNNAPCTYRTYLHVQTNETTPIVGRG